MKVYWRDGSYKTVKIPPQATCIQVYNNEISLIMITITLLLQVCQYVAQHTRIEKHYKLLTLYERSGWDTTLYKATGNIITSLKEMRYKY